MALEIERRFLVSGEAWRAHAGCAQPLRQGYLAASAEGVTVRLRIKDNIQAWLTLKAPAGVSGSSPSDAVPVSTWPRRPPQE